MSRTTIWAFLRKVSALLLVLAMVPLQAHAQNIVEPIGPGPTKPVIIRVSDDLEDRKPALEAMLRARAGWELGEQAQYEIVPNPEFPDDLWVLPVKGMTPETREAFMRGEGREGAMTAEQIAEFFRDDQNVRRAWANNVPQWIDIGSMEVEGFEQRLAAALDPILRREALLALESGNGSRSRYTSTCLSARSAPDGLCPMPAAKPWNSIEEEMPLYVSVESSYSADPHYVTVIAIAPDKSIVPIISRPVRTSPGSPPDSPLRYADNHDSPTLLPQLGHYDILTIVSEAPINPAIWRLPAGGFAGPDTCSHPLEVDLCQAMLASSAPTRWGAETSFTVQSLTVFSNDPLTGGIVNADDADAYDAPFQAQLFFASTAMPGGTNATGAAPLVRRQDFESSHHCGGSYLRGGYVLTSAHCIPTKAEELKKLYVRLGTVDISKGGTAFRIESIARHNRGGTASNRRDIALIKLAPTRFLTRLEATARLDPIPVAAGSVADLPPAREVRVFGWGFTGKALPNRGWQDFEGNRQSSSQILQKLDLQVASPTKCARRAYRRYDPATRLCVVAKREASGICYKDSGGPLIRTVGTKRYLVGIVTAGIGCALSNSPMLFMEASKFAGWIDRAKAELERPGTYVRFVM